MRISIKLALGDMDKSKPLAMTTNWCQANKIQLTVCVKAAGFAFAAN